jgi:hypothetical protein
MDFRVFAVSGSETGNAGDGFARDCRHYHAVARISRLFGWFDEAAQD